ncbi:tetratricopeptide repeat protein [Fuerstiella marisgermanici]|uniref:Type IV pilus biogenesis/stability protein n=1 Tax=Fuerstiella marisgermanici TaxID=1891926 RepID=A0A1P8WRC1_9PLAN|nr:tetratricopeptide repeat protein [Fuerstiella marisgermanici]APZ96604.1 type IV pilus biogenesis/stability protein [Fuerstiella marisgermanici]
MPKRTANRWRKKTELLQLLKEWEAIATELYGENSEAAWQARLFTINTDWKSGPFTKEARETIVERLTDILEQPAQDLSPGSGVRCEAMQLKAFVLNDLRRHDEAVSLHRELVAELEKRYPENHDRILHGRHDLAFALMNAGKEADAEDILRSVVAQSKNLLGEDHPRTLSALRQLGRALFRQRKLTEAAEIYEDAILIRKNSPLYVSQPIDIRDYGTLGTCYAGTEQFSKAEKYLRAVVENPGVKKSARFSLALNNYVACLQKQRKFDQVLATIEQYLTREFLLEIEKVLDERDIEHVDVFLRNMGKLLSKGAWDLAVGEGVSPERWLLAIAYGELATKLKEDPGHLNNYGVALFQNGDYVKAIDVFEKADSMIEGGDREHRMFLAMAHWHVGNHKEARKFYEQGFCWQEEQNELDEVLQRFSKMAEELMEFEPGVNSKL